MSRTISDKVLTGSRGRPRSPEAQRAIITAFIDAVRVQGYAKVSIDGIARDAGVSRSTIYRWYSDKSDIALEAAAQLASLLIRHALTGNFKQDLDAFLQQTFATANELGQLFTALMARAQADKVFAQQVWENFSTLRRNTLSDILRSAPKRKPTAAVGHEIILDMVFGAIWYRLMSNHAPLDKAFRQELTIAIERLL